MTASDRHIFLQHLAVTWIRNRAFKICVLTEVNAVGYIADVVAIAGMQSEYHTRYARHSGLEKKYANYGLNNIYKEYGDIDRWYACVFEVKVSRADFLNTFSNKKSAHAQARMKPVGTAHWVVAEKGICEPQELPEFWGLLTPYGAGLSEKKKPKLHVLPDSTLHAISFEMMWLQMNYRQSYFDQMIDMAKTVKDLHLAIRSGSDKKKLLELSSKAAQACRGFAH